MRERKKKNYMGILVSLFIAFIMITSVIGYMFGDSNERTAKYNGLKFTLTDNGWKTKYAGNTYSFSFLPQDLENINISGISLQNTLQIDVTYDYNSTYAENIAASIFELSNLAAGKNAYLRQGFTTNTSLEFPILTCSSATQFVPVLYFKASNETGIKKEGNCIIIESRDSNGFLPLADRLAYHILGIMD